MKRRAIVLMILAIAILSGMSFISLLLYFDPYSYKALALILLSISMLGFIGGLLSLLLYFIKKIYYRGDIGMYHILSSVRQSFFVCCGIIGVIYINSLGISLFIPTILIIIGLIFLELFIQSL